MSKDGRGRGGLSMRSGGCALFSINTATTVEYDLLKVQGNRLYFRVR